MSELPLEVRVDPDTGEWRAGALPMILVPRHFVVNLTRAFHDLGGEAALREAGRHSAREWCRAEAAASGARGEAMMRHYLDSLSRRGWGRFYLERLAPEAGEAEVEVRHSAFARAAGRADAPACGMFLGWLEGAVAYAAGDADADAGPRPVAREIRCAAVDGGTLCRFRVAPAGDQP